MNSYKRPKSWALYISILIFFGILFSVYYFSEAEETMDLDTISDFAIVQENSLASLSNPNDPPLKVVSKMPAIITAYSSTPWQTDDTPFITASGSRVREGIIANNYLSFGTKVRIPEIYGDRIFTVEDRMNWKKSNYQVDIWFPDYQQALVFGAQRTHIEILGR